MSLPWKLLFIVASIIGFAIAFILAVGFAAHGSPDKWLVPLAGLLGMVGVLLP
jgi:hypothetical protein